MGVHQVAATGFGEGTNDLYDRARPSYPSAALHYISSSLPSRGGLTLLEPGSGTGIFTRLLLSPPAPAYPAFDIKRLVAVEPSAGMRGAWARGLERLPPAALEGKDVRAVEGGFDDFANARVDKEAVDGVLVAQAWHWCPDYDKALRETAAYLAPGAPLVLIWNLESSASAFQSAVRAHYEPYDLGTPQYYRGQWRATFAAPACGELFAPVEEAHFAWDVGMTEDGLVDRLLSKSYLTEAHLKGKEREAFVRQLREIIRAADKEWVDEDAGVFKFKYDTDVFVLRRK
ncbi:hypothetical protein Q5752_005191 [Cryptotrichosporon argae]